MAKKQIPVYMICGFLESGKTNFISPMLTSEDFTADERTLLLVTEEGEEEYDPQALMHYDVRMETFEDQASFNKQACTKLDNKYHPTQVVVEYNGMWNLPDIQEALPEHWVLYQIVTTVDATTFDTYSKNMAQLMMQHISNADMVVFNRCTDALVEMLRGRNLKMLNRRAQMYLEYNEERMEEYDDGTPPFDLSKPVLELSDEDYGVWYVDVMDNPDRYQDKVVTFLGQVAKSDKFPRGTCAAGRFAMVCCAEDTSFLGVLIKGPEVKSLETRQWAKITGRVQIENVKLYQGEGPVLHILEVEPTEAPKEELVYF
jgi:uncharacterized membrane protein YcgQ (UPF0703/DUF1980 family)